MRDAQAAIPALLQDFARQGENFTDADLPPFLQVEMKIAFGDDGWAPPTLRDRVPAGETAIRCKVCSATTLASKAWKKRRPGEGPLLGRTHDFPRERIVDWSCRHRGALHGEFRLRARLRALTPEDRALIARDFPLG